MRDERRGYRFYDLQPNLVPVDPVEQAHSFAEEHRCQRDRELIDQARVEVLEDGVGTAGDPDIPTSGNLTRLPQCARDSVVDEVERGSTWPLPWTANLLGQDEDRRMEWGFLGPETFASVEHA